MAVADTFDPDIHAAAAACWAVLLQTPSAVVTDIDGTISAIAGTPAEEWVKRNPQGYQALAQRHKAGVVPV